MIPRVRLEVSKHNFVFRATEIWNKMVKYVLFQRSNTELPGLIIPGSTPNSDLGYVKNQIKRHLRNSQIMGQDVEK